MTTKPSPQGLDLEKIEEWFSTTIRGSAVDRVSNQYGRALIAEIRRLRALSATPALAPAQMDQGADIDRLIEILDELSESVHGDDCNARGESPDAGAEDKDADIEDQPCNFLEKCDCGLARIYEAWQIAECIKRGIPFRQVLPAPQPSEQEGGKP